VANITQIGQNINGGLAADKAGDSVSINGAGDIVAVAMPGSRLVRVYKYTGNNWVKIGQDITVSSLNNLAIIVRLNKSGDTLAVASYDANQGQNGFYNNDPSNDNIIIYAYDGTSWNVLGQPFYRLSYQNLNGSHVNYSLAFDLNGVGDIVIVNFNNTLRTFKYSPAIGDWYEFVASALNIYTTLISTNHAGNMVATSFGGNIVNLVYRSIDSNEYDESYGYTSIISDYASTFEPYLLGITSISLNSKGNRIAIGMSYKAEDTGTNKPLIQIYDAVYLPAPGSPTDLFRPVFWTNSKQDRDAAVLSKNVLESVTSASLNSNGDRLAFTYRQGASGNGGMRIYKAVGTGGPLGLGITWEQLGSDIIGANPNDYAAAGSKDQYWVSINMFGDRVAVGTPGVDTAGQDSGSAKIYFVDTGLTPQMPTRSAIGWTVSRSTTTAASAFKRAISAIGVSDGTSDVYSMSRCLFKAVGSSAGVSTSTGVIRYNQYAFGVSTGTGLSSAVGTSYAASNGQADSTSTVMAIGLSAIFSVGLSEGYSSGLAVLQSGYVAIASAIATSTVTADLIALYQAVAISSATSDIVGVSAPTIKSTGTAISASLSTADSKSTNKVEANIDNSSTVIGEGRSLFSASGYVSAESQADSLGSIGKRAAGSSNGSSSIIADGKSLNLANGNIQGYSYVVAISKAIAKSVGNSDSYTIVDIHGSRGINAIGISSGSSLAEARKLSDEAMFMVMLNRRRGKFNTGHASARMLELSGAQIIEPTAFEPDAATYRGKYYYNANTNILYCKVISHKQPGVVVAYWQKVSQ